MPNCKEFNQIIAKGSFMVVNGLVILLAYCILGFVVVDMRLLHQYAEDDSGSFLVDMVIMLESFVLIMIAIAGLVGAVKGNVRIIYTYISFMMIEVLSQMFLVMIVTLQRRGLEIKVSEYIRDDFFRNHTLVNRKCHETLWDTLQMNYECCGLNGPDDYLAMGQSISMSCCPRAFRAGNTFAQKQFYKSCILSSSYYSNGCEDELLYVIRSDGEWLLGAAVICFWFEGGAMLLASWVVNNIKNNVQVYQHTVKY